MFGTSFTKLHNHENNTENHHHHHHQVARPWQDIAVSTRIEYRECRTLYSAPQTLQITSFGTTATCIIIM